MHFKTKRLVCCFYAKCLLVRIKVLIMPPTATFVPAFEVDDEASDDSGYDTDFTMDEVGNDDDSDYVPETEDEADDV